jgi:putrescine aminotransferase
VSGAVAWSASRHRSTQLYAQHVNPAFVRLLGMLGYGRVFERADGVWVWDHEGRRYLDALAGFGAFNLGHNPPRLVERLREHLGSRPLNLFHIGPSGPEAELAAALAARAGEPLSRVLLANSGAEAVEAGLKLARAATGREGFVAYHGGYHGTNLGTLSVMDEARMRRPFEPLLSECTFVPFGDLPALRAALATRPAAFLIEPVQAEGGVVLPPPGYLREARRLCREHGALFVLDEVQTGLGRTGSLFAYQQEDLYPDVLVLAKALGGGVAAVSAALTSPRVHDRAYGSIDRFDLHSSTFGGNSFACVAALETLAILDEEDLVANATARGEQLLAGLRARLDGHPFVRAIRGRGLLVGLELGPTHRGLANSLSPALVKLLSKEVFGQWAALKLLERQVICQPASQAWNVLRLEPPLTITAEQIELLVDTVAGVLDEYQGLTWLLTDVSARFGRQLLSGWRF